MGAPILLEDTGGLVDPMDISMREFREDLVPITVKRLMDAVH